MTIRVKMGKLTLEIVECEKGYYVEGKLEYVGGYTDLVPRITRTKEELRNIVLSEIDRNVYEHPSPPTDPDIKLEYYP